MPSGRAVHVIGGALVAVALAGAGIRGAADCVYHIGGAYRFSAAAVSEFELRAGGGPQGADCPAVLSTAAPWVHLRHELRSIVWTTFVTVDANPDPTPRTALIGDLQFGVTLTQAGTVPAVHVPGDFDGDGAADPTLIFDTHSIFTRLPAGGLFYGWQMVGNARSPDDFNRITQVVMGDFDGDSRSEIANFDVATGVWHMLVSSRADPRDWDRGGTSSRIAWGGSASDIAVPADYDGDGVTDLAFYRPTDRFWYIRQSRTRTARYVRWGGVSGEIQVPADYDGDGVTDVAFYRPSDRYWYILRSSDQRAMYINWGGPSTDVPLPADYDGDGRADAAFYRPTDRYWYIRLSSTGAARYVNWGASDALPMPADYDGDGRADVAFFRPFDQHWYIIDSSTGRARYLGDGSGTRNYQLVRIAR